MNVVNCYVDRISFRAEWIVYRGYEIQTIVLGSEVSCLQENDLRIFRKYKAMVRAMSEEKE